MKQRLERKPSKVHIGGLNWVGRNKDGVSMWRGLWRTIPKAFCNTFKILGICLITLSAIFASIGLWAAVPGPLIAGTCHSIFGFYFLEKMRRKMDLQMTIEQAAEQLKKDVEDLKKVVEEKQIRPTYILNDEPIYELQSFGPAGILLRATEHQPENDATLLRPAGGNPTESQPDHLLRPAGSESASSLPESASYKHPLSTDEQDPNTIELRQF